MNEYIIREALRNALYEADAITMKGIAILNQFPAADVVEVVRCRECEHWQTDWEPNYSRGDEYFCAVACKVTGGHFYCADGERKKET